MNKDKILVTKTFLPPLKEYVEYLDKIWDTRWLTNNGPLAQEFEEKMKNYLGVKHALYVSNATVAMQVAIKALALKGEIITTPFTFAATTTSIIWEDCKPIFVDIDPKTFSIDASKIEKAITKDTVAILAVHVYGYPCDVKEIERIAKKYNLKVIYDAAHAFGVNIDSRSLLSFGDISTLSFHATKLFHTGEGGLMVTNDDEIAKKIIRIRNFGYEGEDIIEVGINAKNSEMHAAMGLSNFKYFEEIKESRRRIIDEYKLLLKNTNLHDVKYLNNVDYNFSYFPVVMESEEQLLEVVKNLNQENIFPRRYFYPSLNTLPFVEYQECPVSESIAKRVLCLPLYHDLSFKTVREIVNIILNTVNKKKISLSIGIPAYNEEGNIANLINSIYKQNSKHFSIEEIIVNSDGSSDKTIEILTEMRMKYKNIKIIDNKDRMGKPHRLNEIYELHKGDLLLTLDADILPLNEDSIGEMVKIFLSDNNISMVSANLIPIKPKKFLEKIIYTNDIIWNYTRNAVKNGDHIANVYGQAQMLSREFSKKIKYPINISSDNEFLYMKAREINGYRYARNSMFLFKAPSTFKDIILQGKRNYEERYLLLNIFGEKIIKLHAMPLKFKIRAVIREFIHSPLFTLLAIFLNLLLITVPFKDDLNEQGMWRIADSTKNLYGFKDNK